MEKKNPYFGWILKDNPNFWEDNGFKKVDSYDYHYYGCATAKLNKYPVHRKTIYINENSEDVSMVEVFPCDIGCIKHNYIVSIHIWNNAGGSRFSLVAAQQICSIRNFNQFILDNIGDNLEDGSYLLKI